MFLLADIGGTNTRLALADESSVRSETGAVFSNDSFASFDRVLDTYLRDQNAPMLSAACFAIAGPVIGETARLTNRDWTFDTAALGRHLKAPATLVNDLEALAMALPFLSETEKDVLVSASQPGNGQYLAVGVGTGMNLCALRKGPMGTTALRAEYGHAPLPFTLCDQLSEWDLPIPESVENLFSGRGLRAFRDAGGSDPQYAGLLGLLCAALAAQYLPRNGIFLAGGVARAILSENPTPFAIPYSVACPNEAGIPPVSLVTSDIAALNGCLAALNS
ncbi:glucokinase [Pelagimonas sp. KU-00592-HH]|uniref:glucokinase n=1 Tax=Pelagimonas sp. KU-00592-HH TaxID=3127651 RepID=UPI003109EBA3